MNWSKALISGVAGGVVMIVYEGIVHGMIMAKTYAGLTLFRQDGNPALFPVVAMLIGVLTALVFAKTRSSWAPGMKGGINFGIWMGLIFFAAGFSYPLMFQGFPYYLVWCWGGISVIEMAIFGAVVGTLNKG